MTIATLIQTNVSAQDMVKDGGQDGLMKTVTFDVSQFTDIRDKKLQDVMMKMPGLSGQMSSGGMNFSYNGMSIERIYVNGADVLQGNNQPVYNLKPEDVECLEITENHISIEVMRGKTYSNSVSINVVMKESAGGKWSGSVKALGGGTPLLGATDINGLKLGAKVQTTVMLKADNTGLDYSGPLHGYGDYGGASDMYNEDAYNGIDGVSGSFDYNLRKFLDVEPSLAPLSSERVRFNRSSIAEVGSTYKLSDDYQLNVQVTLHANRLKANSLDETTYYMEQGNDKVFLSEEDAKMHQYDIQTSATLLSNTPKQFLRNKLIFNHRRIDMVKNISGNNPNLHDMNTNPIYLKNDFHIKRRLGDNVLSINAMTGYNTRPQQLLMNRYNENAEKSESLDQNVKATSAYFDLGAKLDISLTDNLNLSFRAGGAYNSRNLDSQLKGSNSSDVHNVNDLNVLNAFGSASLTFINDKMQAEFNLPALYSGYDSSFGEKNNRVDNNDNVFCFYPSFNVKYDVTKHLSLALSGDLDQAPIDRKRIYSGVVVQDFKQAVEGYPSITKNKSNKTGLQATYRNPEHSFFLNGSLSYSKSRNAFLSIMRSDELWMVSSYMPAPDGHSSKSVSESINLNKGISYLKGKIGLILSSSQSESSLVRGQSLMPYSSSSFSVAPYINGRIAAWCNVIYNLTYNKRFMQMGDLDETSTQSYEQSLELIFSPWDKLNFSLLGEHYYTEFSDDLSKHLVLVDFKAEYNLSDRWQLILNATNILNQNTYNYTLVDSSSFTRSFTSYGIRNRNVLLGFFYKF